MEFESQILGFFCGFEVNRIAWREILRICTKFAFDTDGVSFENILNTFHRLG